MSLRRDREQKSLFEVGSLLDELFERRDRLRFQMFQERVLPALENKRGESWRVCIVRGTDARPLEIIQPTSGNRSTEHWK